MLLFVVLDWTNNANHATDSRSSIISFECIDISLNARVHTSRENSLRLPRQAVYVQERVNQVPYSWKMSEFMNLHDSSGFSIIRE